MVRRAKRWTKEKLDTAKEIVQKSKTKEEALGRLQRIFDERVSDASLRNAFQRNGLGCVSTWLDSDHTEADATAENIEKVLAKHNTVRSGLKELKDSFGISEYKASRIIKEKYGRNALLSGFLKKQDFITVEESRQPDIDNLIKIVKKYSTKKSPILFRDLCDALDLSPKRTEETINAALAAGYQLSFTDNKVVLSVKVPPQRSVPTLSIKQHEKNRIRLGVISDTHCGSKAFMKKEMQHFINTAYDDYDVRTILHAGDMLAGNKVYKGQEAELEVWGCSDQCDILTESLPERKGLQYIGILGNHDVDFIKSNGADPAKAIGKARSDIRILGHIKSKFVIEKYDLEIEIAHIKSSAHARSYSLEKHIYRTISNTNSPDVIFCGHRHINGYFEVQGIHAFLVPCFENANIFVLYNDFKPSVGGLIVDLVLDKDNNIIRCDNSFHIYYCDNNSYETVNVKGSFKDLKK